MQIIFEGVYKRAQAEPQASVDALLDPSPLKMYMYFNSGKQVGGIDTPGLAKTALIAPANAPAAAVCGKVSCGKGEIKRLDIPYAANSNEFTPAIPIRGLAIPTLMPRISRNSLIFMKYLATFI